MAEQSVKVLELLCKREAKAVFEADGLQCILGFVKTNASTMHQDALQSALSVASMLCGRLKPDHSGLSECLASLTAFLEHRDLVVVDPALESLGQLVDMFMRSGADLTRLNEFGLINALLQMLTQHEDSEHDEQDSSYRMAHVVSLLLSLARGSHELASEILDSNVVGALQSALQVENQEEKTVLALLGLVDVVVTLVFRGFDGLKPLCTHDIERVSSGPGKDLGAIDAIRNDNIDMLIEAVESGADVNFVDHFGQSVLVWAAYTGTPEMAELLINSGADPNLGRNPPLHYAARFGRPDMVSLLLRYRADPFKTDGDGKTALDQARHATGSGREGRHQDVVKILEEAESSAVVAPTGTREQKAGTGGSNDVMEEDVEELCDFNAELALKSCARLLPVLVRSLTGTMQGSVRKNALNLIGKMVSMSSSKFLARLAQVSASEHDSDLDTSHASLTLSPARPSPSRSPAKPSPSRPRYHRALSYERREFGKVVVDILATLLPADEEETIVRTALQIVRDLMAKSPDTFFKLLLREGVVSHVEALAGGGGSHASSGEDSNGELSPLAQLAHDIGARFFSQRTATPVGMVGDLRTCADRLVRLFLPGINGLQPSEAQIRQVLTEMREYMDLEEAVSPFELENAGVVDALVVLLACRAGEDLDVDSQASLLDPRAARRRLFFDAFCQTRGSAPREVPALVHLVRKLQAILAAIERLPMQSCVGAHNMAGLDVLKRPLRLQLRRAPGEDSLIDLGGKVIKAEPLYTIQALTNFLASKVEPKWYDLARPKLSYVAKLQRVSRSAPVVLEHSEDFDTNGLFYYIGTNGGEEEWVNPVQLGLVSVSSSDGRTLPYGKLEDVLSRDREPRNCHTKDRTNSCFTLDLGVNLIPTAYTLRHARGYGKSGLRTWQLQASKDGVQWTVLRDHQKDESLVDPGSTHTWTIEAPDEEEEGWRHVRIIQMGPNGTNRNFLSISGFELYGKVTGVFTDKPGRMMMEAEAAARQEARMNVHRMVIGSRVVRGFDWKWNNQDGGEGNAGIVQGDIVDGWVDVKWDHGDSNRYRMGAQDSYDLKLVEGGGVSEVAMLDTGGNQREGIQMEENRMEELAMDDQIEDVMEEDGMEDVDEIEEEELDEEEVEEHDNAAEAESMDDSAEERESEVDESEEDEDEEDDEHDGMEEDDVLDGEESDLSVKHVTVQCDGCDMFPVMGSRYKCSVCRDFDLCHECYMNDVHTEEGHTFYVLTHPNASRRMVPPRSQGPSSGFEAMTSSADRGVHWDPSTVLKREFEALEAAFDARSVRSSRPAGSNHQLLSLNIPEPGSSTSSLSQTNPLPPEPAASAASKTKLTLFLSMPLASGSGLISGTAAQPRLRPLRAGSTVFREAHAHMLSTRAGGTAWDQMYTVTYRRRRESDDGLADGGGRPPWDLKDVTEQIGEGLPKLLVVRCMQERAAPDFLKKWKLSGSARRVATRHNCSHIVAAYAEMCETMIPVEAEEGPAALKRKASRPLSFTDEALSSPAERHLELVEGFMRRQGLQDKVRRILLVLKVVHEEWQRVLAEAPDSLPAVMHANESEAAEGDICVELGDELICDKLTGKLRQQIADPLAVTCAAIPNWRHELVCTFPPVFPLDVRQHFFQACSFGVDRAVAAMQHSQDRSPARMRQRASARTREEDTGRSLGNLKQERVTVRRGEHLLEWAMNVMRVHAPRKAILEVSFADEEGHGSGVTNEFYTLVSYQLQRRDLGLWLCDDPFTASEPVKKPSPQHPRPPVSPGGSILDSAPAHRGAMHRGRARAGKDVLKGLDMCQHSLAKHSLRSARTGAGETQRGSVPGSGEDDAHEMQVDDVAPAEEVAAPPPSLFVHRDSGLFFAPLPPDAPGLGRVLLLARFLGTFIAKALLDNRLVTTLPQPSPQPWLSAPHELLAPPCRSPENRAACTARLPLAGCLQISLPLSNPLLKLLTHEPLLLADLRDVDPDKARHMEHLLGLAAQKRAADAVLDAAERQRALAKLPDLADYCLTMEFAPSSTMHGYASHPLVPGGGQVEISLENVEEYVERMSRFMLHDGVAAQVEALRAGVGDVFPAESLRAFSSPELRTMLLGEGAVAWTREELLEYLEPRNGYDAQSATFLHLVEVLAAFDDAQRRAFLRFATGVGVLPPGGLKNLDPKLTVVRKVCEGSSPDQHMPSANTCFHFLKLPEYSSEARLAAQLRVALQHGMDGFFFN